MSGSTLSDSVIVQPSYSPVLVATAQPGLDVAASNPGFFMSCDFFAERKTMAFDLSFSEEFFFAPGDTEGAPFDRENPVSLYQAICVFAESEEWPEFYKSLFDMEFNWPLTEGEVFRVMELARETNTCTDLSPPVEVWLDSDGDHRVSVYEERSEDNE